MNQRRLKIKGGKEWLLRFGIGIGIGALVVIFVQDSFVQIGLFEKLHHASIDRRFEQRGPLAADGTELDVVIVGITRESFRAAPDPYPFPREYYARAIRNLNKLGARVIGIDLLFDMPSYQAPEQDKMLYDKIKQAENVVLSGTFQGVERRGSTNTVFLPEDDDTFGNVFFTADSSIGFVQMRRDSDGVIRRYPIAILANGGARLLPSFSTAILNRYDGRRALAQPYIDKNQFLLGNRTIPRVAETTYINYYGPSGTFTQFDIIQFINDETFNTPGESTPGINPDIFDEFIETNPFKNKVVLIGPVYPESQDLHSTPVYHTDTRALNQMYGIEIHANMIQAMIDDDYLRTTTRTTDALLVIITAWIIFMLTSIIRAIKYRNRYPLEIVTLAIAGGAIYFVINIGDWFFSNGGVIIPIAGPVASIVFGYFGSAVHQYVSERRQKVIIKSIFSHYVSPEIMNELLNDPEQLRLGGEKKELTVLFSDIAGFTSLSEVVSPEVLAELLNKHLDSMAKIIINNYGTLDKYEGDAIMAFWGAPIKLKDHALLACISALQMQRTLDELRKNDSNKLPIHMRIGINTGEMIVGNFGGKDRFDYTVIGDAVNIGARFESVNKNYGTNIIIGENTYKYVQDLVIARKLDTIIVKGKTKPTTIYELIGMCDDNLADDEHTKVKLYNDGIKLYPKRRWKEAVDHFNEMTRLYPEDTPSRIYLERSKFFLLNPPPDDWTGITVLESK